MRTGGYAAVQQALTFEATSVVKQSISLAKRRGHAQVTPLHVASTMLSLSDGIFRTACLQSHSHPLQCKALELCFNVELNRLPVVSSRMSAVPQPPNPTISNALVAAFKRAQANQRRGSIENQQQQPPLVVVKIELEQLIISILDDPSVSRVMREAGFLSTQVKGNVEQLLSLDHEASSTTNNLIGSINITKTLVSDHVKDEDVGSVLEGLIKKRRSIVVVGECLVTLENVLKQVKDKFEKGIVPNELKEVKFISIPISFVNHIDSQQVKDKLEALRGLITSHVYAKGVVLYVGDLNQWMIGNRCYDSNIVEHVIKVLGKIVCEINTGESGRCWIMGIATFGTYTRCRSSNHLVENRWGLHPITLPAGSLGLSLSTERESKEDSRIYSAETVTCQPLDTSEEVHISSCPDFMQTLELNHQKDLSMGEPCRKRISNCTSESQEKSSNLSSTISSPPFSSISISSYDQQFPLTPTFSPFCNTTPPNISLNEKNKNSHSSSSDHIMEIDYYTPRFKQFNSQNLDMLCNALEHKVPGHKHIIPEISATILQCRSGMLRRKETTNASDHIRTKRKEETWLLFCGEDSLAKERIAKELANVVFGSYSNFVSIALSSFSPTGAFSDEEGFRNKRRREEQGPSCIRKILQAISENPHRVIYVEDLVQVDMSSQLHIRRAIERGTIISDSLVGEEVDLSDAIIILCSDGFRKNIQHVNLDLNISFGDENDSKDQSDGEMGIVDSVDGLIVFRQQELHEELRL